MASEKQGDLLEGFEVTDIEGPDDLLSGFEISDLPKEDDSFKSWTSPFKRVGFGLQTSWENLKAVPDTLESQLFSPAMMVSPEGKRVAENYNLYTDEGRARQEKLRQSLNDTRSAIQEIQGKSEAEGGGFAGELFQGAGQVAGDLAYQLPISIAATAVSGNPAVGLGVMAGLAGTSAELSTFRYARDYYESQGDSQTTAEQKALRDGLSAGAITAGITSAFGLRGIESVLASTAKEATKTSAVRSALSSAFTRVGLGTTASSRAASALAGGGSEAVEEMVDESLQSAYQAMTYNPDLTVGDALSGVVQSGVLGFAFGAPFEALSHKMEVPEDVANQVIEETRITPAKVEAAKLQASGSPALAQEVVLQEAENIQLNERQKTAMDWLQAQPQEEPTGEPSEQGQEEVSPQPGGEIQPTEGTQGDGAPETAPEQALEVVRDVPVEGQDAPRTFNVYRGVSEGGSLDSGWYGSGTYYSPKRSVAESYAGKEGTVLEEEVTLSRPFEVRVGDEPSSHLSAVSRVLSEISKKISMEDSSKIENAMLSAPSKTESEAISVTSSMIRDVLEGNGYDGIIIYSGGQRVLDQSGVSYTGGEPVEIVRFSRPQPEAASLGLEPIEDVAVPSVKDSLTVDAAGEIQEPVISESQAPEPVEPQESDWQAERRQLLPKGELGNARRELAAQNPYFGLRPEGRALIDSDPKGLVDLYQRARGILAPYSMDETIADEEAAKLVNYLADGGFDPERNDDFYGYARSQVYGRVINGLKRKRPLTYRAIKAFVPLKDKFAPAIENGELQGLRSVTDGALLTEEDIASFPPEIKSAWEEYRQAFEQSKEERPVSLQAGEEVAFEEFIEDESLVSPDRAAELNEMAQTVIDSGIDSESLLAKIELGEQLTDEEVALGDKLGELYGTEKQIRNRQRPAPTEQPGMDQGDQPAGQVDDAQERQRAWYEIASYFSSFYRDTFRQFIGAFERSGVRPENVLIIDPDSDSAVNRELPEGYNPEWARKSDMSVWIGLDGTIYLLLMPDHIEGNVDMDTALSNEEFTAGLDEELRHAATWHTLNGWYADYAAQGGTDSYEAWTNAKRDAIANELRSLGVNEELVQSIYGNNAVFVEEAVRQLSQLRAQGTLSENWLRGVPVIGELLNRLREALLNLEQSPAVRQLLDDIDALILGTPPAPSTERAKVRLSNTRSPQTYEVLERLPPQPGDLPEESYFRVKNDKTGEELTVESKDLKLNKNSPPLPIGIARRTISPQTEQVASEGWANEASFPYDNSVKPNNDSIRNAIQGRIVTDSELSESERKAIQAFRRNVFIGGTEEGTGDVESPLRSDLVDPFINEFERVFGTKIRLLANLPPGSPKGIFLPNYGIDDYVWLNAEAHNPFTFLAGHEFSHSLKRNNPELYNELKNFVLKNADDISLYRENLSGSYKDDVIFDEFVSDFVGNHFNEPEFWQVLSEKDTGLFQRLAKVALDFLNQMIGRASSMSPERNVRQFFGDQWAEMRKGLADIVERVNRQGDVVPTAPKEGQNLPAYIPPGVDNGNKLLDFISSSNADQGFKELAKLLKRFDLSGVKVAFGEPEISGSAATFNPVTNTVTIGTETSEALLPYYATHELVHAVTLGAIRQYRTNPEKLQSSQRTAVKELERIFSLAKEQILTPKQRQVFTRMANTDVVRAADRFGRSLYGLTNLEEFVAEVMSDRDFQELMAAVVDPKRQYEGRRSPVRTLWESFKAAIKSLLGVRNDYSALSGALDAALDFLTSLEGDIPASERGPIAAAPRRPEQQRMRGSIERILTPEARGVRSSLSEETVAQIGDLFYQVTHDDEGMAKAREFISKVGEDQAERALLDLNSGLTNTERSWVSNVLIQRFEKAKKRDRSAAIIQFMAPIFTEGGQFISSARMRSYLSPLSYISHVRGEYDKRRPNFQKAFKDPVETIVDLASDINNEFMDTLIAGDLVKAVQRLVRGVNVGDLIRQHYSAGRDAVVTLMEKLEGAGLPEEASRNVEILISEELGKLTNARKKAELEKLLKRIRDPKARQAVKSSMEKLIEASNVGLLNDDEAYNEIARVLKLPSMTLDMRERIIKELDAINEMPENSIQRDDAMRDLEDWINKNENGVGDYVKAYFYASILSGPATWATNFWATFENVLADFGALVTGDPAGAMDLMSQLIRGFNQGGKEFSDVMKSGKGLTGEMIKDKYGNAPLWELVDENDPKYLQKIASVMKWVGRIMVGTDALMRQAIRNPILYAQVRYTALEQGLSDAEARQKAVSLIRDNEENRVASEKQASDEGLEPESPLFNARVQQIMDSNVVREFGQGGTEVIQKANDLSLESVFANQPKGVLGVIAKALEQWGPRVPGLFMVVPFVRTVANVTNTFLDYSPYGFARLKFGSPVNKALRGKGPVLESLMRERPEGLARQRLMFRAVAGNLGMAGLAIAWALNKDKDEEDKWFDITSYGPSDQNKRQQLMASGWRPYTVKIGDVRLDYRNTPIALVASLVGNWADGSVYKNMDEKSLAERLAIALSSAPGVIIENSMLSGLSDLFEALEKARRGQSLKGTSFDYAIDRTSGFFPNFIRFFDNMFDPTVYSREGMVARFKSGVPFVRRTTGEIYNALGEPVERSRFEMGVTAASGRIIASPPDPGPIWQALAEKNIAVSKIAEDTIVRAPDGLRLLSANEYADANRIRGELIKKALEANLESFRSMPADQAQKYLDLLERRFKDRAIYEATRD